MHVQGNCIEYNEPNLCKGLLKEYKTYKVSLLNHSFSNGLTCAQIWILCFASF